MTLAVVTRHPCFLGYTGPCPTQALCMIHAVLVLAIQILLTTDKPRILTSLLVALIDLGFNK